MQQIIYNLIKLKALLNLQSNGCVERFNGVRQVCCQVTILGSDLTTKTASFRSLLKSKGSDCFIFSFCFS